jgi:nucleotidyltransferase substrate binding protein (TIGR01987 family)
MMDVRWKQRFQNLEKAYLHLQEACKRLNNDWLIAAGLIQTFEFTFEFSWKTLKDYMSEKGDTAKFPRDVIKNAFQNGLIINGHCWIDMLEKRNELTHTYNEEQAMAAVKMIKETYLPAIDQVYKTMKILASE